jgi:hypothetical protein
MTLCMNSKFGIYACDVNIVRDRQAENEDYRIFYDFYLFWDKGCVHNSIKFWHGMV